MTTVPAQAPAHGLERRSGAAMLTGRAARRTLRGTALLAIPLVALGAAADLAFSPADVRVVINFLITIVLVLGIQSFSGNSGVISFGHVAFMGVGAYVAALVATPRDLKELSVPHLPGWLMGLHLGFLPTLAVAGIATAVVASVVGGGLVRMRENAMAMATFAILVIFSVVFSSWNRMTGGAAGIYGIPSRVDIWSALIFVVAGIAVARLYRESRIGFQLRASREDELAAEALGIGVRRLRLGAWVLSAAFMGVGGAIWAQYNLAFGPQQFDFTQTFNLLAMLVVGGLANVSGAVVGAATITLVTEVLRRVEDSVHVEGLTEIVVALTILVVLRARPLGLVGLHELDEMIQRSRALARWRSARLTVASRLGRRAPTSFAEFRPRVVTGLEVWEGGEGSLASAGLHPYLLERPPAPGGAVADAFAAATRTLVVVPGGPGRLAQHVADLERLRAELGVDEWVLFGSSLGGAVALEYALAHPTSTAGLVLVGTPVSWRFYEDPGSIYSPTHPDAWREEEARRALDGSDGAGRAWLETVLGPAARTRALREFAARARVSAAGLSALRAELLADPPWDLEPRLPEISCPVLVVAGRRDAEVPLREAETLAARLPHARLAVFDASARPAEEEPERFRAEVSAFLEAVETRRGQQEAPGA